MQRLWTTISLRGRQERLDFETDEPEEAVVMEEEKPKGRGRKKRLETPVPLDATA